MPLTCPQSGHLIIKLRSARDGSIPSIRTVPQAPQTMSVLPSPLIAGAQGGDRIVPPLTSDSEIVLAFLTIIDFFACSAVVRLAMRLLSRRLIGRSESAIFLSLSHLESSVVSGRWQWSYWVNYDLRWWQTGKDLSIGLVQSLGAQGLDCIPAGAILSYPHSPSTWLVTSDLGLIELVFRNGQEYDGQYPQNVAWYRGCNCSS